MAGMGPVGALPFGWTGNGGGSGGGGGGTGDIKMILGFCGRLANSPQEGLTTWSPAELIGASQVWVIAVNLVLEFSVGDTPGFTFTSLTGTIDRAPNEWVDGDVIVVWYKPA